MLLAPSQPLVGVVKPPTLREILIDISPSLSTAHKEERIENQLLISNPQRLNSDSLRNNSKSLNHPGRDCHA